MKEFRLPRKTKKDIKKGFYLLPPEANGNRRWCNPIASQKEYDEARSGKAENMMKTWKV